MYLSSHMHFIILDYCWAVLEINKDFGCNEGSERDLEVNISTSKSYEQKGDIQVSQQELNSRTKPAVRLTCMIHDAKGYFVGWAVSGFEMALQYLDPCTKSY